MKSFQFMWCAAEVLFLSAAWCLEVEAQGVLKLWADARYTEGNLEGRVSALSLSLSSVSHLARLFHLQTPVSLQGLGLHYATVTELCGD